jgi:hypothetical protein
MNGFFVGLAIVMIVVVCVVYDDITPRNVLVDMVSICSGTLRGV